MCITFDLVITILSIHPREVNLKTFFLEKTATIQISTNTWVSEFYYRQNMNELQNHNDKYEKKNEVTEENTYMKTGDKYIVKIFFKAKAWSIKTG